MKKKSSLDFGFSSVRVLIGLTLCAIATCFVVFGIAAPTPKKHLTAAATAVPVRDPGSVMPALSPALRDLPTLSQLKTHSDLGDVERILTGRQTTRPGIQDPVVQLTTAPTVGMPPVGISFEGMNIAQGCGGCMPPDTDGAVGPHHYVQMVNTALAVYNKTTGTMISGPTPIQSLWSSANVPVRMMAIRSFSMINWPIDG